MAVVCPEKVGSGHECLDPVAVSPVAAREAEGHANALDGVLLAGSPAYLPAEEVGHEIRIQPS